MNSCAILALLLIWQCTAQTTENAKEVNFNARILAENVKAFGNPVDAARDILKELGTFSLIGEVVQANFIEYEGNHRLLFEMSNPLQAKAVFQAYTDAEPKPKRTISRTMDDFFDVQMEYRTG